VRFRDEKPGDLDRARTAVAAWRADHPAGTADDLVAAVGPAFHPEWSCSVACCSRWTGTVPARSPSRPRQHRGDPVTGRPVLRVIDGEGEPGDPVVRRQRFEQAHPEAVILPPSAGRWRAVVPAGLIPGDGTSTTLGSWDLDGLMDQLDAVSGPCTRHSSPPGI